MRILVLGGGVLGSLYAARLHDAGHDVTILARGDRLAWIREHGIVVRDEASGLTATSLVPAVERPDAVDRPDAVLVFVRREQRLDAARLLADVPAPSVLFMGNDATAGEELIDVLGPRLLLGFPSAGGTLVDGVVHSRVARASAPTVIGEPDGTISDRARELAVVLGSAGFPVTVSGEIGAWLRTHASVVVPVAAAVYGADGDVRRLATTPDLLVLTIRGVREGLEVLRRLDIPVTPRAYRRLAALPEGLLSTILSRAFATDAAELMVAGHARHARTEMAVVDADLAALAGRAGVATPNLDRLRTWIDPAMAPMEAGSRTLLVSHPARSAAVAGASAAAGLVVGMVVVRRVRPDLVARLPAAAGRLVALRPSSMHLPALDLPALELPAFELPAFELTRFEPLVVRLPGIRHDGGAGPSIRLSDARLSDMASAAAAHLPPLTRVAVHLPGPSAAGVTRTWGGLVAPVAVRMPGGRLARLDLSALRGGRLGRPPGASLRRLLDRGTSRTAGLAGFALLVPLVLGIATAVVLPSSAGRTAIDRARRRRSAANG